MCALVYVRDVGENLPSSQQPFSICPKCGRFIKINGQCECEILFFHKFVNTIERDNKTR